LFYVLPTNKNDSELEQKEIGKLSLDKGVPIMDIGNHRLEGKVVELSKPLIVTEKNESSHHSDLDGETVNYDVVGIVRRKYLFKNRPQPKVEFQRSH